MTLTVGSLFSGIGGIDLGLEWAGMRVIWQAENDPYCCKVLAQQWPSVPNHGDVPLIDWSNLERPDLIAGGYPCQPFSHAGRRGGADDPRHVWPYMAEALRCLRPTWALLENVPGHRSKGFGDVLADLASLGYDAQWESVPAAAFGAPHLRWRLFVVAYTDPLRWRERSGQQGPGRRTQSTNGSAAMADTNGTGSQGGRPRQSSRDTITQRRRSRTGRPDWSVEPSVGRMVDGLPYRVDRLKGLGNACVPQVVEWIGHQIQAAEAARLHLSDLFGAGVIT